LHVEVGGPAHRELRQHAMDDLGADLIVSAAEDRQDVDAADNADKMSARVDHRQGRRQPAAS
jgi:hypothetical protein